MRLIIVSGMILLLTACGGSGSGGDNSSGKTDPVSFNRFVTNMMAQTVDEVSEPKSLDSIRFEFEDDENAENYWEF